MTWFEPRVSDVRSNRSTNWATTTANQNLLQLDIIIVVEFRNEMLQYSVQDWNLTFGPCCIYEVKWARMKEPLYTRMPSPWKHHQGFEESWKRQIVVSF